MPNYIIRPTSVATNGGGTTPTTQATVVANLGDNSDATTIVATAPTTNVVYAWVFNLSTPSIPTDEFPSRIGASCRWTGGSVGGGQIWASARTVTEGINTPFFNYDGRSSLATTELNLRTVSYSRAQTAGLQFNWWFQRYPSATAPTFADLWATVYTIKNATASVANVTMTNSVYATIPVTATATIDWEASASDASNLRKVITEVRVEQGGTGVGTGTLKELTGKWWSTSFTATGSQVVNVVLNTALPNGTYKVYARAVRFRENQSFDDAYASAEQTSAWTAAATLTMNNPLPTAPTLTVLVNQTFDFQVPTVTPIATTGHTNPTIDIERTDDYGSTWVPVRGATGIAGTFGTPSGIQDYEAPRATFVQYRARVNTTFTGGIPMTSNWTIANTTEITAINWNLKCPESPVLNQYDVQVIDATNEQLTEDMGVFRPLDRRYPITVSGSLGGWDGELRILIETEHQWYYFKPLLEAQKVLLLESPFGWSKYVRIISGAKLETRGTTTTPRRYVQVSYVETTAP